MDRQRAAALDGGAAALERPRPRARARPTASSPPPRRWGCSTPIGTWVIDALAQQIGEWQALGLEPRVSFNVSPRELLRPDFAAELGEQLRTAGVDPALLTMELTESATLREPERIGPLLRELRALGLQLAIDDFGAGWSSLSRLRLLPVQMLKIDRSFLREIPEDPEAGAIVRAVIALSDALGRRPSPRASSSPSSSTSSPPRAARCRRAGCSATPCRPPR